MRGGREGRDKGEAEEGGKGEGEEKKMKESFQNGLQKVHKISDNALAAHPESFPQ